VSGLTLVELFLIIKVSLFYSFSVIGPFLASLSGHLLMTAISLLGVTPL